MALHSSARFAVKHMMNAPCFENRTKLLDYALTKLPPSGLVLEFGVASGSTINFIAGRIPRQVYGFDSFQGLPEDWPGQMAKGAFKQDRLPAVPSNVELVVGLFEETLPPFLSRHADPVAFIHMDCDIYSSTKTVLAALNQRIQPGCLVVFDEYFNWPGWEQGEHRAFSELVGSRGLPHSYVGYTKSQQVAVKIG
jgi:predicted O-methyltransferase YrrM